MGRRRLSERPRPAEPERYPRAVIDGDRLPIGESAEVLPLDLIQELVRTHRSRSAGVAH